MPTLLIIGATSDIGVAIARRYAAAGCNLQLAGRDMRILETLCSDLRIRYGVECSSYYFDATDFSGHASFYKLVTGTHDITVCVMGYMPDNEQALTCQDEMLRTVHTNYTGAVSVLNLVAADYKQKRGGCIIGVSSVAGDRGRQSNFIYGSAKAGFTAYLSGLRHRMLRYGVHVLTVKPGFVYTRMTEQLILPKLLTATAPQVAEKVYKAANKRKNILYAKAVWQYIMLLIRIIPEPLFKKTNL